MKEELELHQQCIELRLPLLTEPEVASYVARRLSDRGDSIAPAVYARSEGNPLFMVNVVDYVLEQGALTDVGAIEAPRNLRQMIERNLQRLSPEEQHILEAASVAGAEFSAATVAIAVQQSVVEVEACCNRLAKREQFVARQGPSNRPDGTTAAGFRFHHALYQNVLYDALADSHRVELHRRIAERKEAAYGERAGEIAAELAAHFRRAQETDKAVSYLQLAGERAVEHRAYREAEGHYCDGLAMLLTLPDSPERDSRELDLQLALGPVLAATKGFAAVDSNAAYAHARDLSARNVTEKSHRVLVGLWFVAISLGDLREALVLAEEIRRIATMLGHSRALVEAAYARAATLHWSGHLLESSRSFQYVCEHYKKSEFGPADHDYGAYARAVDGLNNWLLGYPDRARRLAEDARAFVCGGKIPFSEALVELTGAQNGELRGDFASASVSAQTAARLCAEFEFPQYGASAKIICCWAEAWLDEIGDAAESIRVAIAEGEALGFFSLRQCFLTYLAEAQWLAGEVDAALVTVNQALDCDPDNRWYRPLTLTLRGDLRLKHYSANPSQAESAEQDFRDAIALSRQMNAKSPELRATTSLARMLASQGKRQEACTMLTEIYNWFTEGFDTRDLKEAKAVLDDLSGAGGRAAGQNRFALRLRSG